MKKTKSNLPEILWWMCLVALSTTVMIVAREIVFVHSLAMVGLICSLIKVLSHGWTIGKLK